MSNPRKSPHVIPGVLENIQSTTEQICDAFRTLAAQKGFTEGSAFRAGIKTGEIIAWLKQDFGLGTTCDDHRRPAQGERAR